MFSSVVFYIFTQMFSVLSLAYLITVTTWTSSPKSVSKFKAHPIFLDPDQAVSSSLLDFKSNLKLQESSTDFQMSFASTTPSSGKGSLHKQQRHLLAPCQITQCFEVGWLPPAIFECTTCEPRSQFYETLLHEFSNP